MISTHVGNLFESKMQTLVNTVNCVGIMGKGLALEFKKLFPDMYEDYVTRCNEKQVQLGKPYLYRRAPTPWIINFPTKAHWRSVSRLSNIVAGLEYLEKHYHEWEITSLAVPALGCSNGQLEWRVVGPTLYRHLSQFDIPVELYAPYGTPEKEFDVSFLQSAILAPTNNISASHWKINPAYIGLVEILAQIELEPYHWPVGKVTFQKIIYFANVLGLPINLNFEHSSNGLFSSGLRPLITQLVNNGLIQETQIGRILTVQPGPTYKDAAGAFRTELAQWESIINRITDLFLRIHTQKAEVAATVHFIAQAMDKNAKGMVPEIAILERMKHLNQRHNPLRNDEVIAQTIRDLNLLGWIKAKLSPELPLAPETVLLDS